MIISYVKEDLIDGVLSLCAIGQNVLLLLQVFLGDSGILPVELVASFRILSSAILVLMAIYGILYRECYLMIGTYIFMSLLFILSYFFFPDNNEYLIQDGIRFTFFINIPVFLSVISIRNSAVFFDYALRMSYICTIIAVLYAFFYFTDNLPALDGSYNMSYGYGILFPALFLLYRSGKSNTILFSVLFICILFIGSRGPLLFIVTLLAGIVSACGEKDIAVFEGRNQIYFEKFYMNALYPGTKEADTTRTSFFFFPENTKEIKVKLVVNLSGLELEKDLHFGLKTVEEGTTAKPEEYRLEKEYTFRKRALPTDMKEVKDTIEVSVLHSDRLAELGTDGVRLVV